MSTLLNGYFSGICILSIARIFNRSDESLKLHRRKNIFGETKLKEAGPSIL